MADEDDLDAQLALFSREIEQVAAAVATPSEPPQPSEPSPVFTSKPARASKPTAIKPTRSPARASALPRAEKSSISSTPASKWKWDAATNKWRWQIPTTSPTAPSTAPVSTGISPVLPSTASPRPATRSTVTRTAAGELWTDSSLAEWPADDHRIFVGDLAPDTTDAQLEAAFSSYPSFNMSRVVRDKRTGECRGYGFVSFADGREMIRAMREKNGKYVGSRPVKLRRSEWQKRSVTRKKKTQLKALRSIAKK